MEDAVESLQREAEELKAKLIVERAKVSDKTLSDVTRAVEGIQNYTAKTRRTLKGHIGKVLCVDWCTDKRHLLSSAQDGTLIIWDAYTNDKVHTISNTTIWVMGCSFGPSGTVVAAGGLDNKCTLYVIGSDGPESAVVGAGASSKKKVISTHTSYLASCKFFNSDNQILTASGDSTCGLWDVESGTMLENFRGHCGDVTSIDVSPTECYNTFVSGSCDGMAMIWDVRTGKCVQAFDGHESDINSVKFHPCGEAFATGSDDATLRMFDLRADREISCFKRQSILFGCNAVDFSLSGRLLFGGYNDYTVNVWDALKIQRVSIIFAHENRVSCLKMSPDGTGFCTSSWDGTLKIWA